MAKAIISVKDYLSNLDHPLKKVVEELKQLVLAADKEIDVQIKWNSLSFFYTGNMKPFDPKEYKRDIVVFNLHKKDMVLLVFPTGARIDDATGLLEGKFTDGRKTAQFSNEEDVARKGAALQTVIRQWLQTVEK
jgi:hypothetical protein